MNLKNSKNITEKPLEMKLFKIKKVMKLKKKVIRKF